MSASRRDADGIPTAEELDASTAALRSQRERLEDARANARLILRSIAEVAITIGESEIAKHLPAGGSARDYRDAVALSVAVVRAAVDRIVGS